MYKDMEEVITDLEKEGELIRIKEEVDPYLEMAAIHLRVHALKGPALLFEKIKGTKYRAVSNIFGTTERGKFLFRHTWEKTKELISYRNEPLKALKNPLKGLETAFLAVKALPLKRKMPNRFQEIRITDLPLIHHWPKDGGAFITLPQVYSENPDKKGIINANLGMYRVQLTGNQYEVNQEVGLHYQIQRGIGVHQALAAKKGEALKVSIFVGGPPAHTLAAVMPLPEGLSELTFAGLLAGRNFRYSYQNGYMISNDADFVITGDLLPFATKPEGPFGDHLGYYSLTHDFPVLKINKVYAKPNAIWPFTVVGRPPQEDTTFGALIHELTGNAIKDEIPGVKEVHAVDAAGVHPLLLAIGSERYTPYQKVNEPQELLTLANRILGTGQLSLAKYLFITAEENEPLDTHKIVEFFTYILERIDLKRDLHFQTNTTIDTLDYSGTTLNKGSKVIFAAYGEKKRTLCQSLPHNFFMLRDFNNPRLVIPGIIAIEGKSFTNYQKSEEELADLINGLKERGDLTGCPLIILVDDSRFVSESVNNFLWVTFTRSNPANDIYGINSFYQAKHWGADNIIIDARIKPHHAPSLELDQTVEKKIERLFAKGGSLAKIKL